MTDRLKKYETIGCCGIDCGLCPRFYTKGDSACPGCGGLHFKEKHPSCGFLTCCVVNRGLEVCSDCREYPCRRFDSEKNGYDSFVTHRNVFSNLDFIKSNTIVRFLDRQKNRMDLLSEFLTKYDDGRSRSFFCVSCALLPLDKLQEAQRDMEGFNDSIDAKMKNKRLREILTKTAGVLKIDLKLNNKRNPKQGTKE